MNKIIRLGSVEYDTGRVLHDQSVNDHNVRVGEFVSRAGTYDKLFHSHLSVGKYCTEEKGAAAEKLHRCKSNVSQQTG